MKLTKVFDYIYYRLASFYENKFGNEDRFNAIAILSIIQCTNLLSIVSVIYLLQNDKFELSTFVMLLLGTLIFVIINSLRYNKTKKYQELKILWCNETISIRFKNGFYIIIYFVLSIVLTVFILNFVMKSMS